MFAEELLLLKKNGVTDAETTLDILCAYILGIDYSRFRVERITGTVSFSDEQKRQLRAFVCRRCNGEPVEYITNEREFYGFSFRCKKNVLIPRNDTEILVDTASELVSSDDSVLDLCTGTGCVGISIAKTCNANVVLADISQDALCCARENIERLKVSELAVAVEHNVFTDIPENSFDLITANPPYITAHDMEKLSPEVKNEPQLALFGGEDGLDFYRVISERYKQYINNGGHIVFEVGYDQARAVCDILEKNGYTHIKTKKDYNNIERVVTARNLT